MYNVKIKINIKKNCGNLLANADVTIPSVDFGQVVLKDFQIWKSPHLNSRLGQLVNIQPPSVNCYGKFRPRIFFEDESSWQKLELQIWNSYQAKEIEEDSKQDDIVIPEDMPF